MKTEVWRLRLRGCDFLLPTVRSTGFRERPAYLNDCKKNGLAVLGGFALQMRMSFLPDNETKRRLAMTILKNNRIS